MNCKIGNIVEVKGKKRNRLAHIVGSKFKPFVNENDEEYKVEYYDAIYQMKNGEYDGVIREINPNRIIKIVE